MASARSFILCIAAAISLAASIQAHAQKIMTAPRSGYAPVNGLKLHYETHGNGQPLILLHGSLGSSDMFGEIMTELSQNR